MPFAPFACPMLQVNIASIFFIKKAEQNLLLQRNKRFVCNQAESNALTTQMLRQFSANANCKLLPNCPALPLSLSPRLPVSPCLSLCLPRLSLLHTQCPTLYPAAPALWAKENALNFECQANLGAWWRLKVASGSATSCLLPGKHNREREREKRHCMLVPS